ncbi:MAG: prepilin-type N-terminal cleavage/methylation domain-containing protein [Gemmatimonadaceae bacterium]|nr:prepilin-type N-terminal cleavage/methylation domain-containing protein [Gemmatimonadaceae bacterium]
MRATTRRHGVTLIEMIVALLLLLIVLGVGSLTARRSIGAVASIGALESRSAALRDALTTLSRHVAGSEPHRLDLLSAHDSVLELRHTIGVSTLCHARIDTLVIGGSNDSLPWGAAMPRAVTTDDQLRLWDDHQQRWRQVGVRGVSGAGGVCGDSIGPRFGLAAQRVIIDDTLASIAPGAVVRVLQRERWSLLRGGDGLWDRTAGTFRMRARRSVFLHHAAAIACTTRGTDRGRRPRVCRACRRRRGDGAA